ncbi:hypothetical protein HETIRDRAFT_412026 [Heterobasidion irregulare TC 32-1]|uniref:Uncharacterized protein n=1 Tax=Heterobasidion irregulare (strain TC 32-1) TaxID=747525 RepID=W4JTH3_HETIT|nr:uncharacterized protein HETIRDRAFT_412026 [Heterobasidion irregulare TC 32-1]ETW76823.1 hypothetical protein HETIRDRAFT_412026 [Heterobasidion irregulare TC 32-1]
MAMRTPKANLRQYGAKERSVMSSGVGRRASANLGALGRSRRGATTSYPAMVMV